MKNKEEIKKLKASGLTVREIVSKLGISKSTVNKAINEKYYLLSKMCSKKYAEKNKQKLKEYHKNRQQEMKKKIISFYSDGDCVCACCGESSIEFLSVDHIKGDGNIHRREIGQGLYTWLIKNKMPEGFRILCMNCNHSYGHYGTCPHNIKNVN